MASDDRCEKIRPPSVKELNDKAKDYDWNPVIGFRYWARAAETIYHEVRPLSQPPRCFWGLR